jgi:hypothetical protein
MLSSFHNYYPHGHWYARSSLNYSNASFFLLASKWVSRTYERLLYLFIGSWFHSGSCMQLSMFSLSFRKLWRNWQACWWSDCWVPWETEGARISKVSPLITVSTQYQYLVSMDA